MSTKDDVALCDECGAIAISFCECARCTSEPTWSERFHACRRHEKEVARRHVRIRGEHHVVAWKPLNPPN
jgi:hypothetical protein